MMIHERNQDRAEHPQAGAWGLSWAKARGELDSVNRQRARLSAALAAAAVREAQISPHDSHTDWPGRVAAVLAAAVSVGVGAFLGNPDAPGIGALLALAAAAVVVLAESALAAGAARWTEAHFRTARRAALGLAIAAAWVLALLVSRGHRAWPIDPATASVLTMALLAGLVGGLGIFTALTLRLSRYGAVSAARQHRQEALARRAALAAQCEALADRKALLEREVVSANAAGRRAWRPNQQAKPTVAQAPPALA